MEWAQKDQMMGIDKDECNEVALDKVDSCVKKVTPRNKEEMRWAIEGSIHHMKDISRPTILM